ncbi:MAG: DNA-processing protein DprA, partial [Myxococcota bacterium]|nr:DNA-processing protein DprA [Myxococcota bacterium]
MTNPPRTIPPLSAMARATILARTRRPAEVLRAVERGDPPAPETDQAVAENALRVRGLYPWIPTDPAAGPLLIVRGAVADTPGVAIVGARASDPYGLAVADAAAREAVDVGRSVVSGGAEGCDAAAH